MILIPLTLPELLIHRNKMINPFLPGNFQNEAMNAHELTPISLRTPGRSCSVAAPTFCSTVDMLGQLSDFLKDDFSSVLHHPTPSPWDPLFCHTRSEVKGAVQCLLYSLFLILLFLILSCTICAISSRTARPAIRLQKGFNHVGGRSVYWGAFYSQRTE